MGDDLKQGFSTGSPSTEQEHIEGPWDHFGGGSAKQSHQRRRDVLLILFDHTQNAFEGPILGQNGEFLVFAQRIAIDDRKTSQLVEIALHHEIMLHLLDEGEQLP